MGKAVRLLAALAIAFGVSSVAWGAACTIASAGGIACVQEAGTFTKDDATGTVSQAYATNTTAGNLLIAICSGSQAVTFNLVTDSQTNTWSTGPSNVGATGHGQSAMYYKANAPGGADTVSCKHTGTSTIHVAIYEISGIVTTSPLDASGSADDATNTSHSVTTSGSIAQSTELVVGAFLSWNVNNTFTAGSGYTKEVTTNDSVGGDSTSSELKILTAGSGTQTAAMTFGTTDTGIDLIATFKGTATGGATCGSGIIGGGLVGCR